MLLTLLNATFLTAWPAGPAVSQPANCAPRANVVDRLASKFGETRQSMGLGTNNSVIEVFASDETGTWTITVTRTDGISCLVASGQAFEAFADALPPVGNDA
ncbi:hypothetical protein [Puniceibacterium confluentis]|uniref:hypothetical protein n=1 Tax=Puniceibacterium confluentis TaxID=1958944 RepID=UPI0035662B70